jgi:hypothetical protein
MGIDITCNEKSFSCGYGSWNKIRIATIIATAEYLKYLKTTNQFEERTYPYVSLEIINEFMSELISYGKEPEPDQEPKQASDQDAKQEPEEVEKQEHNLVGLFLGNCTLELIDVLIFFGLGGLFSLCNKSDCEGYYSVGNAYDICELFHLIRPFLIENLDSPDNYANVVTQIEDVFKESVEISQKILIC